MKCRNIIKNSKNQHDIVWFGSYGKEWKVSYDSVPLTGELKFNMGIDYIEIPKDYYIQDGDQFKMKIGINFVATATSVPFPSYGKILNLYVIFTNGGGTYQEIPYSMPVYRIGNNNWSWTINQTIPAGSYDKVQLRIQDHLSPPFTTGTVEGIFYAYFAQYNAIKAENYAKEQHGVACSLIQRLSVIKGELWYKSSYGLPLMDKIKNKGIYDSIIINIINSHPDVRRIEYFNSSVENHSYVFNFIVNTIYNENVEITYTL